jgi:hypothetical protein
VGVTGDAAAERIPALLAERDAERLALAALEEPGLLAGDREVVHLVTEVADDEADGRPGGDRAAREREGEVPHVDPDRHRRLRAG